MPRKEQKVTGPERIGVLHIDLAGTPKLTTALKSSLEHWGMVHYEHKVGVHSTPVQVLEELNDALAFNRSYEPRRASFEKEKKPPGKAVIKAATIVSNPKYLPQEEILSKELRRLGIPIIKANKASAPATVAMRIRFAHGKKR